MDHLLLDIKNFLKKLQNGQMEIEAGQWELHKDLANVKKSIEEMRKLKEDVEEMKLSNVEAMELIKGLENKLEACKTRITENGPRAVSESTEDCEEIYKIPNENHNNAKGYKKRRCHKIVSEKIVEITSDVDSNHTVKKGDDFSDAESLQKGIKKDEYTAENNVSKLHREKTRARSDPSYIKKKRCTRKPDNVIMERYLNDSAKYQNRGSSNSLDKKKPAINDSICTTTIRPEPAHGAYWDDLDPKKSVKSQQKTSKNMKRRSSQKLAQRESILPKLFFCPRCPKSFSYKSEFAKHQKYAHENSKQKFYCKACKKFYNKKCRLKDHESLRFMKSKSNHSKAAAYKCSFCNKISNSPEKLTAHIKRCRIISRANFKRK